MAYIKTLINRTLQFSALIIFTQISILNSMGFDSNSYRNAALALQYGGNPLLNAANNNDIRSAKFSLQYFGPNIRDKKGETPLHIAVKNNFLPMTKLLLKHGACPTIPNKQKETVLQYASSHRKNISQEILDLLFSKPLKNSLVVELEKIET